jgi:hypothetical protein
MPPPSRKKVKPPTNDMQFNHHEANQLTPPDQQQQTQQNLNQASKTMHTTTRTSTHWSKPSSNVTPDQHLMTLEGHRRLRKSLDDMKAKIQRQEAAKQTGRECL